MQNGATKKLRGEGLKRRVDSSRPESFPHVIELPLAQPQNDRQDLFGEIVSTRTGMKLSRFRIVLVLIVVLVARPMARAGGERKSWKPDEARKYLDERQNAWFAFSSADRGEGETRTSCVSCHTVLPYALARPVLRKLAGAETATPKKLVAQTRMRVENWKDLDSAAFGLFYDSNARKKQESWGTEAVLNTVILAFDDRSRSSTSEGAKQALTNLMQTQVRTSERHGSWEWLDLDKGPSEWD